MLNQIRLGVAFLILAIAIAIVGCEAVPLHHYKETSSFEKYWLVLWPLNLDLRQTNALLACGAVIAFQALIYIIVAVLPSPHSRTRLLTFLSAAVALMGFITSVTGVIFAIHMPSSKYPNGFTNYETIHSWTCRWKSLKGVNITDNGQSLSAPASFSHDCMETRAGFILLGLLIGLEVIMGAGAAAGWFLERSVEKKRCEEAFELQKATVTVKGP
ncbi:conserved hypothetical protein [Paecilomyces variotii No. 5]|uniref:Uncharacterized protein n=1 Tax=Byssochlamys spectabilis (strain No. 5 / NBRC 109023) TaxID=1356009 RepID=V5FIU4_BYSSN|nr:conserved hypothetical protein [Paecilomyces variotii No. 5]